MSRHLESNPRPFRTAAFHRAVAIAALVGTVETVGHLIKPVASWWWAVHLVLPTAVFSYSALQASSGTRATWIRGVVVVACVFGLFTYVNSHMTAGAVARGALNYAIPFTVSLLGSASASRSVRIESITDCAGDVK